MHTPQLSEVMVIAQGQNLPVLHNGQFFAFDPDGQITGCCVLGAVLLVLQPWRDAMTFWVRRNYPERQHRFVRNVIWREIQIDIDAAAPRPLIANLWQFGLCTRQAWSLADVIYWMNDEAELNLHQIGQFLAQYHL